MSYNISHVENLKCDLTVSQKDLKEVLRICRRNGCAEINFLEDLEDNLIYLEESDGDVKIDSVSWSGDGSGHTFDTLKDVLPFFKGEADLVFIWEGGDSLSGLKVRDGTVTEHRVKYVLGERKKANARTKE